MQPTPPPTRRHPHEPRRARAPRRRAPRLVALTALSLATAAPAGAGSGPAGDATVTTGAVEAVAGAPDARHPGAGAPAYRVPLDGPTRVVNAFDPPPAPWLAGHRGVDLAASRGTVVLAPGDGVVTFAGPVAGRGVVSVQHPDGLRSSVEPVDPAVAVGAHVRAGDPLGAVVGDAHGRVRADPVVHWGVRDGETYVDPWDLLPGHGPVVLLPVG